MAVRKKGGQYQADFMVSGKRYRFAFATEREAEAWELEARAAIKLGKPVPEPARSVGGRDSGSLAQALRSADTLHWSRQPGSAKQLANAALFVRWAGPALSCEDGFNQDKIDEFREYLIQVRHCSNGTINRYMSAVSILFNHSGLPENRKPKLAWYKEGKGRVRYHSDEEEALILQTLRLWGKQREADLFVFLWDTGARPYSEATAFAWDQTGGGRGYLGNRKVTFDDTKNGIVRTLPLTTRAWEAVQRQPKGQAGPWTDMDQHALTRLYDRLRSHIPSLSDTVVYTCRHTCASRLAQRGVDIRRVKDWMGHTTIITTMKYAHLAPEHLLDAAAVLEPGGAPKLRAVE